MFFQLEQDFEICHGELFGELCQFFTEDNQIGIVSNHYTKILNTDTSELKKKIDQSIDSDQKIESKIKNLSKDEFRKEIEKPSKEFQSHLRFISQEIKKDYFKKNISEFFSNIQNIGHILEDDYRGDEKINLFLEHISLGHLKQYKKPVVKNISLSLNTRTQRLSKINFINMMYDLHHLYQKNSKIDLQEYFDKSNIDIDFLGSYREIYMKESAYKFFTNNELDAIRLECFCHENNNWCVDNKMNDFISKESISVIYKKNELKNLPLLKFYTTKNLQSLMNDYLSEEDMMMMSFPYMTEDLKIKINAFIENSKIMSLLSEEDTKKNNIKKKI